MSYKEIVQELIVTDEKSDRFAELLKLRTEAFNNEKDSILAERRERIEAEQRALELKRVEDSKKRVERAIKSGLRIVKTINKEERIVGRVYIDDKLRQYGYEPTYWSQHERHTLHGVQNVRGHYKNILKLI